jgi:hypothetical protein
MGLAGTMPPGGGALGPAAGTQPAARPTGTCAAPGRLGPAPLRRLTHDEYANTVRDLLRLDARPDLGLPKEGEVWGLTNNVLQQTLSPALVERYYGAAERLSALAAPSLTRITGCDLAVKGEDACRAALVDGLGQRAFRRPLIDDERESFQKLFAAARMGSDFKNAARAVIEGLLVAPQFLFRSEIATGAPGAVVALDGWAIATRLSYMVWGSMPDDALFAAAAAGKLGAPQEIAAQVERMLGDGRARATMRRVHSEWLEFDRIEDLRKDGKKFPEWTPALQASLRGELDRFIDDVFDKRGGSLEALFTSPSSFVDAPLAKLYGAPAVSGMGLQPVELDPTRRAGVLTRAGVLASLSNEADTALVHRGLFVRERLLCQPVPPPPPNANAKLPAAIPGQSTRQRYARHKEDPTCAGCHALTDPIGLALENYDAIGRWRDAETAGTASVPIDASGELSGVEGGGAFTGANELGRRLAGSATASACASRVWFRYAFGRTEAPEDTCALDELAQAMTLVQGRSRELLVKLAQSDAFRFRTVTP